MHELFSILTTLPVLPFAVGLGLCVVYWLVALASGIDLGTDGLDGAADGAIDGALDGAMDGATDGVIDGAMDGAADGALDGAADGAVDGAADGATDGIAGGVSDWSVLAMLATILPLGKVPVTVWVSLFSWWGFLAALGGKLFIGLVGLEGQLFASLGSFVAACVLALGLAGQTSRPLQPLFRTVSVRSRSSLVGEMAEVTTGRVDARFGQAKIVLGGDELLVHVRCDRPNNGMVRGQSVVVVEFDKDRDAFIVEPMIEEAWIKKQTQAQQSRPSPGVRTGE